MKPQNMDLIVLKSLDSYFSNVCAIIPHVLLFGS